MGEILDKAINFAVDAHKGQFRKHTDTPYILHPLEAAAIVGTMTSDDEVIAAAVLHDVIEDTDTDIETVEKIFGKRIAGFVSAESEDKREDRPAVETWKIRKEETLAHLRTAPTEVKMITLGDKLSNVRAINRDLKKYGEDLWQRFNQKDKKQQYWYYKSIADLLSELKDTAAYNEYVGLLESSFM